jgi:hypothetical protein
MDMWEAPADDGWGFVFSYVLTQPPDADRRRRWRPCLASDLSARADRVTKCGKMAISKPWRIKNAGAFV